MAKPNISLKDFLKKFSSISNGFIDDLFSLYGPSTQQSDYVVNLDAAAKWLEVRRHNLILTLQESYKNNIDYVARGIPKQANMSRGGHNRILIFLTPDCFKRVCMRSRGSKAEAIRTYFIELEGLVLKYKDHMMAGMQAEIDRLERGEARHAANKKLPGEVPAGGYIYVMRASERMDEDVFKLGMSIHLRRRLREHQSSRSDDIEVMFVFRTDNVRAVEACAHGTLLAKKKRHRREIFECDIDVIKAVVRGCEKMQERILKLEYKANGPGVLTGGCYMCIVKDDDSAQ